MREQLTDIPVKTLTKTDRILHAIYETDKFRLLTKRYFELFMIKENKTPKEIKPQYRDFIYKTISEKFENVENAQDVKDLRTITNTVLWKLKKRWAKSALDSLDKKPNKLLKKEYLSLRNEKLKQGKISSMNIENPEDIISIREDFFKDWCSKITYNVSDYPYLDELSISKINSAFTHDLIMCVTEILKDEYEFDINKIVINSPVGLPAGLFAPYGRGRRANVLGVSKVDELSYESNDYDAKNEEGQKVDVRYTFSTKSNSNIDTNDLNDIEPLILELKDQEKEKKALSKLSLDKQDLDIIRFAYSYSYINSYSLYVSDIIKFLGLNGSKHNYRNVENRLLKLPYYTFYHKEMDCNGDISETTFNLFSRINIKKDSSGRKVVKITKAFVEEVEKRNAEIMYRNELKKLKSHQSVDLAYFLEGRRSYLISTGVNIKTEYFRFDMDFLKFYIHLNNKKTPKQRMLELELAFKEIKENQFIIKDYKMGNSYFEVLFYEDIEKRQLLLDNTILSLPDYLIN